MNISEAALDDAAVMPAINGMAISFSEDAADRRLARALSADAALLERLPRLPRCAHVHSVFDRAINIDVGGWRLLTLAYRGADNAPDTVVVDVDSWATTNLAAGAEVFLCCRRVALGDARVVALEHARPWHGRLPAYAQDEAILRANLQAAQDHLAHHGTGIGRRCSTNQGSTALEAALVKTFRDNAQELCRALARHDELRAIAHVGELVGLGPGLTPSGDDFLLGLLAALNIPDSPHHACRRIGAQIVACANRQTNSISAAALRHASKGRVRANLIGLCDALMHASATEMLNALDTVLRIGSSSGTDIALGVLAGFRIHLGFENADQTLPVICDTAGGVHGS